MRQSLLVLLPAVGLMVGSAAAPGASSARAQAPAPARTQAPERQCFFQHQIDNFRSGASPTLYLKIHGSGVYEITASGACSDLDLAYRLAIVSDSGFSRLCADDFVTISTPGSAGPAQTCRAHIDRKLTEAEVAALPSRYRP